MDDLTQWLNLALRFGHVLAAIMWVGSSIFFMWLDSHLEAPDPDGEDGDKVEGQLWMIHGGGIFHTKKRLLAPDEIPKILHWFKWEAYMTWLTGFFLLATIHYMNGGAGLPGAGGIGGGVAVGISLGALGLGWLAYDLFWRSRFARTKALLGSAISFVFLIGAAYFLCRWFNGRAAFLHVGAMLGTMMAGNVFFHIIPNQRRVMAALEAGGEHDVALSAHAKLRSTHNNYMTFPVIFLMISFHYPWTYGAPHAWAVLALLVTGLATIRHFLNIRGRFARWLPAAIAVALATVVGVTLVNRIPAAGDGGTAGGPPADPQVAAGESLFTSLICATCHVAQAPTVAPALAGVFGSTRPLEGGGEVLADEAYLRESILNPHAKLVKGYLPVMPPLPIEEDDLAALIAYLKTL